MSTNMNHNTHDTNGNSKFIRAVEEAFFLLDRDQNRSINSEEFCAIAKSVGKTKTEDFIFILKKNYFDIVFFFLLIRYRIGFE